MIRDFDKWLGDLPHRHKIVIPGNHEFFLETDPSRRSLLTNATVLINEGIEVAGLRIWGTPVTPLYGGAFGVSSAGERKRLYDRIPAETDVLITHGPPFGTLDAPSGADYHAGDRELLEAVMRIKPKLHLFGHIHGANGIATIGDTVCVNAALLGPHGGLDGKPIVLEMKRSEGKSHDTVSGGIPGD